MFLLFKFTIAIAAVSVHCAPVKQNETVLGMKETKNLSSACINGSTCSFKLGHGHKKESSTVAARSPFLKYGLLAILLIPLTLFPILFLFTRGDTAKEDDETEADEFEALSEHIVLLPTMPAYDAFLADTSLWGPEDNQVVLMDESGLAQYHLLPSNALLRPLTGQLYHPQTGLLFNPIRHCTFDASSGHVINGKDNCRFPAHPNLVYKYANDNILFERSLAMSFSVSSKCDSGKWQIARSPVPTAHPHLQMNHIRRICPEELPEAFAKRYARLLTEWQAQRKYIRRMTFTEQLHPVNLLPVNESTLNKDLIYSNFQYFTPKTH